MSSFQWGGFGGNRPQSQPQQTSFAAAGYRPSGGQPQQTSFAAPGGIRPMPGRNNPFGMMNPGSRPPGWSGPSQYPIARPSMSQPWRMPGSSPPGPSMSQPWRMPGSSPPGPSMSQPWQMPGSNSMPGEHPIRTADIKTHDWKMPSPESNPWRNDIIGAPASGGINQVAHDAMLKSQMGQQGPGGFASRMGQGTADSLASRMTNDSQVKNGYTPDRDPIEGAQNFQGRDMGPRSDAMARLQARVSPDQWAKIQEGQKHVAQGNFTPGSAEAGRAASYGGTQLQKHRRRGFGGFANRMLGKAVQNAPGGGPPGAQSLLNKGPAGQITRQNHRGQQNQNATPTTMNYGQNTFQGRG